MKLKLAACTFLCSSLLITGSAFALPLLNGRNLLNDTSGESLVKGAENGLADIQVGDFLVGDIVFGGINNNPYSEELTGHFDIKVQSITVNPTGGFDYVFVAPTASGEVARLYLDSKSANFATPSTFVDGSLWAVLGLTDANTKWTAHTDTNNIGVLLSELDLDPTGNHGLYNYALDVIENHTGLTFLDVGNTGAQFVTAGNGSFQLIPTGANAIYGLGDQSSAAINVVPEPATMSLFGLGLIGLGLIGRRRIAKK